MVRRESIEGHDTIMATLVPKAGVKPQTDDGKIMRHFKARAWISESDYELVRVEIEAIDDLSFGLGLLARVHKGTTATYQRRKVNDEVWLPAQVTWTASARVLLLKRLRLRGIAEFSGYRKFTVDTSTDVPDSAILGGPVPPAPQRHERPDRFDQPERPRALQKAVDRSQRACSRERQDEPVASILERVARRALP